MLRVGCEQGNGLTFIRAKQRDSKQNEQLIKQIESLKEQLDILTKHRFGRKTEVSSQILGQLSLYFGDQAILNESELVVAESLSEEPTIEVVIVRKKCTKGTLQISKRRCSCGRTEKTDVLVDRCRKNKTRKRKPASLRAGRFFGMDRLFISPDFSLVSNRGSLVVNAAFLVFSSV